MLGPKMLSSYLSLLCLCVAVVSAELAASEVDVVSDVGN